MEIALTVTGRYLCLLPLVLALALAAPYRAVRADDSVSPASAPHPDPVRDYFFYICVHEYYKGQSLDQDDVSVGYIFEYLTYDFKTLNYIITAAKNVAHSIKQNQRPGVQVAGGDYHKTTVLATCLEQSRLFKVPKK